MPFKSEAQRRLFYAKHPKLAKKWERETPKGKRLPDRAIKKEAGLPAPIRKKLFDYHTRQAGIVASTRQSFPRGVPKQLREGLKRSSKKEQLRQFRGGDYYFDLKSPSSTALLEEAGLTAPEIARTTEHILGRKAAREYAIARVKNPRPRKSSLFPDHWDDADMYKDLGQWSKKGRLGQPREHGLGAPSVKTAGVLKELGILAAAAVAPAPGVFPLALARLAFKAKKRLPSTWGKKQWAERAARLADEPGKSKVAWVLANRRSGMGKTASYDEKRHKQVIDYLRRKKLDAHTPEEPGKPKHFDVHVDAKSPEHAREISQSIASKFPLKKSFKNATHLHKVQDSQGKQVGLVAITVKAHIRKMPDGSVVRVEEHTRKRTKKPFARGLPSKKKMTAVPNVPHSRGVMWEFGVHDHHARRAGRHFDLRLGDPRTGIAHSWAVPKSKLPAPGEKLLAIQQPDHTLDYMSFRGVLKDGYGAGKVDLHKRTKTEIVYANESTVVFKVKEDRKTDNYVLKRTRDKSWLLMNITPNRG